MRAMTATVAKVLCMLFGAVMIVLGAAVWRGFGPEITRAHIIVGFILTTTLGAIAARLAARRQSRFGYALLLLAVVMALFGIIHPVIPPGSHHWIVRVAHLLIGAVAISAGYRLSARLDERLNAEGSVPAPRH
jgi:multisubunit Na+/H+ antiporter MnhE subunit